MVDLSRGALGFEHPRQDLVDQRDQDVPFQDGELRQCQLGFDLAVEGVVQAEDVALCGIEDPFLDRTHHIDVLVQAGDRLTDQLVHAEVESLAVIFLFGNSGYLGLLADVGCGGVDGFGGRVVGVQEVISSNQVYRVAHRHIQSIFDG